MPAQPILIAHDLSFAYQKNLVFSDVSFILSPRDIAVLVGRNGSGKSTLMRCLAGWAPCKSGVITLCGNQFEKSEQKQRSQVFFVNDTPVFYDYLTAEEHIRFVLSVNNKHDRISLAGDYLEKFDLYSHRKQLPSSYSQGMRLKLALVIALTLRPPLLLFDEPFGPLDPQSAVLLCEELDKVASEGCAILLSQHQQIESLRSDVIWRLEKGKLLLEEALDRTQEVLQHTSFNIEDYAECL